MRPLDLQAIGQELAIKWEDGSESFVSLEKLRKRCPCAGCQGERDVMGRLHKGPDQELTAASYQLRGFTPVGGYAIQPIWGDGHATGLFSFDYLRQVAEEK
ncbi:MAG TPA: DUF971 domain-containing protein [Methylomirabilota bacterium]|jgi:DUF971 family protein|nr:DUF971 domain-containing protein [Methylomirabilota bacterium]